jgi:hypothetical protein
LVWFGFWLVGWLVGWLFGWLVGWLAMIESIALQFAAFNK